MHRSIFPLILASLGFFVILIVVNMPLFEWHIGEIVTDTPSTYKIDLLQPSPWRAYLGDFLDDGSYIFSGKVRTNVDGSWLFCREETLKIIVIRSEDAVCATCSLETARKGGGRAAKVV